MIAIELTRKDELMSSMAELLIKSAEQETKHVRCVKKEELNVDVTPPSPPSSDPSDSDSSRESRTSR